MGLFPTAINQKKFVIVDVDIEYFIKWPKAEAVATITQRNAEKFLWKKIVQI